MVIFLVTIKVGAVFYCIIVKGFTNILFPLFMQMRRQNTSTVRTPPSTVRKVSNEGVGNVETIQIAIKSF